MYLLLSNYVLCCIYPCGFVLALVITRNPMDETPNNGTATFTCAINGTTTGIEWFNEDGFELESGVDGIIITNYTEGNFTCASNLTLMDITNGSFQTYTCSGSNDNASVNASAILSEYYSYMTEKVGHVPLLSHTPSHQKKKVIVNFSQYSGSRALTSTI